MRKDIEKVLPPVHLPTKEKEQQVLNRGQQQADNKEN